MLRLTPAVSAKPLLSESTQTTCPARLRISIAMEIRSLAGHVVCVLSDNSGFAETAGVSRSIELVDRMAAGLAANVHREQGPIGTIVLLTFPIDEVSVAAPSNTRR